MRTKRQRRGRAFQTVWGLTLAWALSSGAAWAQQSVPRSLYADLKASRVGDVVTVLVLESTQASRSATIQTGRSDSIGFDGSFRSGTGTQQGASGQFGANAEHNGGGETRSSGVLRTTVTAVVTEVLPNGYLQLEGTRILDINGEKEILRVRGICRPQDIRKDNTILSNQLANAEISYTGEGLIAKHNKPNLFLRILSSLLPFF
ncbi:MAG: flagellar L-ring protein [Candidatus Poribacteria bacterium]|nr:MAG: flagellar L-ring protein [Candidatus Poribacteria bacterium]